MRILRIVLSVIGVMLLLVVIVLGGTVVALNTGAGRVFAEQQINHFAGPGVHISGLAGRFPTDIKLASVSIADADGVWLTGADLELRWKPTRLLQRTVDVTSLTAAEINVLRQPIPGNKPQSSTSGLLNFPVDIAHLAVPSFKIGAALAGEDVTLNVTGATHFLSQTQAHITLNATTPDASAVYDLDAGIDPKTISMQLHVAEPPDGLLGHYAGPLVHEPLALDMSVAGPRDAATLKFSTSLGAAKLDGTGTLDLDPKSPKADVVFNVPALTPFAALANKKIAGNTKLHLVIARQKDGSATLSLQGDVKLTAAPYGLVKLVGPSGQLSLLADLRGKTINIQQLDVSGAAFNIRVDGSVAQAGVNLNTHVTVKQVSAVSPGISGSLQADGTVIGPPDDFAINTLLTGNITTRQIPSGPFRISINVQHLPNTPVGTLTGSGALENSPLFLDAAFSRDANGAATLTVNKALWRSMKAQADLSLAPGATLPTGTAKWAIGQLADFAVFSPTPLKGSVTGDFAYSNGKTFKLNLDAKNLVVDPLVGEMNGTVSAAGTTKAAAVRVQATVAKLISAPARIALAGVLNLEARTATIASLSASWRELNAALLGPAEITTRPDIAVRHLSLSLNGGQVGLDGTLSPRLNATLTVQNLPASLASMFGPSIKATGMVSATAILTGSRAAPNGKLTLDARNIRLHSGPAAALPAADFTGTATVTGKGANVTSKLTAGPNISLAADGLVPLNKSGPMNLHVAGRTDMRLLDPILAVQGNVVRGLATMDLTVTGTPISPRANGTITLANGSIQNIGSGLSLTNMSANILASGQTLTLQKFQATAGKGMINGHGTVDLGTAGIPLDLALDAHNATPFSSDLLTETLDAALTLKGALRSNMALGGTVKIDSANINIPKNLPPSVANLPIINAGEKPPPPPPPPPPIALDLKVTAKNQIFVRGEGLFAELGGDVHITGTAAKPAPQGGFELIRGSVSLAGKTLQFTQGNVSFNGIGFMPTLDLEASTVSANNTTATLIVGGTAAKPTITLTSSPPMPSDEILAQLLFGEKTTDLSPFQAASVAAALAQLTGLGGGFNPLGSVRTALGLDELSLTGGRTGPPSVHAGRYVAPGVYVGATQATNGQGTQATVEINLYKGLKLETATGTSSTGTGDASSVGLSYQFNY